MNTTINIYKRDGSGVRFSAPISESSKYKYMLMSEDSITLRFSHPGQINFQYGDYINTSGLSGFDGLLCGKYIMCDATNPNYDYSTCAYEYEVKFDAWYMHTNRHLFMLPYISDGDMYRRECKWDITASIEEVVRLWLLNAYILGYRNTDGDELRAEISPSSRLTYIISYSNGNYRITRRTYSGKNTIIFGNGTYSLTFDNSKMIDSLNTICDKWGAEWWFDSEGTLKIGKRQLTDTIEIESGVNARVSASGSSGSFATRLYAFGSDKNLTSKYKKSLTFTVSNNVGEYDVTDNLRPLITDYFKTKTFPNLVKTPVSYNPNLVTALGDDFFDASTITYTSISTTKGRFTMVNGGTTYTFDLENMKGITMVDGVTLAANTSDITASGTIGILTRIARASTAYDINRMSAKIKLVAYNADGLIAAKAIKDVELYGFTKHAVSTSTSAIRSNADIDIKIHNELLTVAGQLTFKVEILNVSCGYTIISNSSSYSYTSMLSDICTECINFTTNDNVSKATFDVMHNNKKYLATINAEGVLPTDENACKVTISNAYSQTAWRQKEGDKYTIVKNGKVNLNSIPDAYYSDNDDILSNNGVSDTMLKLPNGMLYVDLEDENGTPLITNGNDIIEEKVVFDDIFPSRSDTIKTLKKIKYAKEETDDEGNKTTKMFEAYMFDCYEYSADFSKNYISKTGDGLKLTFSSGAMAGMTFGVEWNPTHSDEIYKRETLEDGTRNPEARWFEILVSDEYGRLLPDDTLHPSVGDEFVLYGFDASYIDTAISEAEQNLLNRAKAYLLKQIHNDRTYSVELMPYFAEDEGLPIIGTKFKMDTLNYFLPEREERVIGIETCLDCPYDYPKCTVGESAMYSRIGDIERQIKRNNKV